MNITLEIETDFPQEEVNDVVRSALKHEQHIAKYKINRYAMICDEFEDKYDMNSNEFMKKFEASELMEEGDYFDWYAAKRGLEHSKKKLEILSKISV